MKKILDSLKLTVWTAEFAWKVVTFLIVAAGGTTASVLAAGLQVFHGLGWLAWFGVGLLAALLTALTIYLVRAAGRAAAEASATVAIAVKSTRINPLRANFSDEVIHLADLHLPGRQVHEHKQFRNCKFVGPGAVVLLGGTFVRSGFHDIGHILTLPDNTLVTGITVLQNCTVEDCEFYRTTLLVPRGQAEALRQIPGVQVAM
ncbi:hypothetical protein ACNRDB_22400 [Ralstonia pseudosolanacearum]|uniref:hypothetical protein n=1 Tax=Ralstonia pseudosolanacearum TaxID=1310165 RepID=UPI0018D0C5DC|nr:hypothetical protein [Ralstonia pseudosolanacearum]